MKKRVFISSYHSIQSTDDWSLENVNITNIGAKKVYTLHPSFQESLNDFLNLHGRYRKLDRSCQMALYVAHEAFLKSGSINESTGVNFGSSRGATEIWEKDHKYFIENGKSRLLTSPITTLGNISSNIAKHIEGNGPSISHSITCSTSLQAISNACAWLKAEMCSEFIVGGAEAPNGAFTIGQMSALGIYSNSVEGIPCKPLEEKDSNTLVLGEGAAAFVINDNPKKAIAEIAGIGYAMDNSSSLTGIPEDGQNIFESMEMATNGEKPDLIIAHAPGTIIGDQAEQLAIENLFGKDIRTISTKGYTGHTLGASGAISIARAISLLGKYNSILINAVGFGGNAGSILLKTL